MRVKLLIGLSAGLALSLAAVQAGMGAPAVAQTAVSLPATAKVASDYVDSKKVPGLVIGVGMGDAPAQFTSAGRIAAEPDAPAADENSLWRVYSMTKPITGIAAMILVEQGKLELDAPISKYIPAFKNMKVLVDPAKGLESRPATAHQRRLEQDLAMRLAGIVAQRGSERPGRNVDRIGSRRQHGSR